MATDRRRLLLGAATALVGRAGWAAPRHRLWAGCDQDGQPLLACWEPRSTGLHRTLQLELPTRGHGLAYDARRAAVLMVARRPGDWLLRFSPGRAAEWHWIDDERAFKGHAVFSPDGLRLYTSETDLGSGAGLIGVRDARSLRKIGEWPTGGRDPHALLLRGDTLLVANGGLATQPETGRRKLAPGAMDSSLVRIERSRGRIVGQWRLPDTRLSLRHLVARGGEVGIALQAEHDDEAARRAAPVLALFDERRLRTVAAPLPLAGYAGDIAADAQGYAVSCPRAGGVAWFDGAGGWRHFTTLAQACALARHGETLWAGGARQWAVWQGPSARRYGAGDGKPDNHALWT